MSSFSRAMLALSFSLLPASVYAHEEKHFTPDSHAPAGVMVDHMHEAGSFMIGYRHMFSVADGKTMQDDSTVSDQRTANAGYGMRSDSMIMHMGMLDIMYAPTNWLTLMVMPQFTHMTMEMAALPPGSGGGGGHGGHGSGGHGSTSTGLGDTSGHALVRLFQQGRHHIHAGFGLSAPTGSVYERGDDGRMTHYGMQLGSGTWDFLPSITYTGGVERWGWGLQLSGIKRLEGHNDSGYRLGDQIQTTAWSSYRFLDWLSASLRVQHTALDSIKGHYHNSHNHDSPPDLQGNYGGQFFDVGIGLNLVENEGSLKGHRLSIEWLQPVYENANGFQQARTGALTVNWSMSF